MKRIDKAYINGEFTALHGTEIFELINPSNHEKIGEVILADQVDTRKAIAAAKEAFKTFSKTSVEERIQILKNLKNSVDKRKDEFIETMIQEYGGTRQFCTFSIDNMTRVFDDMIETLRDFEFDRKAGNTLVQMMSLGVVGIITPWNSSNSFICSKFATAVAAGCTVVVKPSEMSALQTQLIIEWFHEAGLPKGIFNVINGLGGIVGNEIVNHPDIAKISFTGSTNTGKMIAKGAVDTMKRVTLELGGKSPNIILDDADFEQAIPQAVFGAYMNSGQACIAPTRLLVPQSRLEEVNELAKQAALQILVGNPADENTNVGPMVSENQYNRVQSYIKLGLDEGAVLLTGGTGKPEGLENGNFVKATIFTNVRNDMRIAQEEIFGPVLSIISYENEEEAVAIANDTSYGLAAYITSSDENRALKIASQIEAGRVCVNGFKHDPLAPFGGFKQSGIGREFGTFGLEEYLEPKSILV
ncbi:aldehyde dehydrogenase family protein [Chryseobacterium balustinum]|uniref:Aldehyde dehydrogenase n=1 Tax=Chryseobacterium balustinum TaxID=246 RepID=A0AAX2IPL0_9FLAO|nr:aldehyde dehydrogenase family protein [Chryseobacterium balustinum]AZB30055.1 aldehyde dehydrogenase family protein [Chryseobacterium balustinum]SKB66591.1 aldehyde dehydrogenase (NAD+) [Chryseobacterium balustinum]SQA91755.1 Putative aldehyde dehydrogenase SA1924 [Chryseobacterium balustinum]